MEETRGHIAIGAADKAHLERSAKWAQFIAIVQFIFIGLGLIGALIMILAGGIAGASLSEMSGMYGGSMPLPGGFWIGYGIFIILMLVVSFFLALFLYRFATKTLQAIAAGDDAAMTAAFENLGKYFQLSGILLIISLSLMMLMIVFAIIGMAAAGL